MKENGLKNFCCNIKRIKEDYKLNDGQMMKIMHISHKTLKSIKNGALPERVSVEVLFYLNKHLNIDIPSLFTQQYKINGK